MKLAIALALSTSLLIAGCASTEGEMKKEEMAAAPAPSNAVLAQAKTDLDAALAAGAQWRVVDPATGSSAVDLNKLYAAAEKKAAEGDIAEAERIAEHVSQIANTAVGQAKRYAGSMPYYQ